MAFSQLQTIVCAFGLSLMCHAVDPTIRASEERPVPPKASAPAVDLFVEGAIFHGVCWDGWGRHGMMCKVTSRAGNKVVMESLLRQPDANDSGERYARWSIEAMVDSKKGEFKATVMNVETKKAEAAPLECRFEMGQFWGKGSGPFRQSREIYFLLESVEPRVGKQAATYPGLPLPAKPELTEFAVGDRWDGVAVYSPYDERVRLAVSERDGKEFVGVFTLGHTLQNKVTCRADGQDTDQGILIAARPIRPGDNHRQYALSQGNTQYRIRVYDDIAFGTWDDRNGQNKWSGELMLINTDRLHKRLIAKLDKVWAQNESPDKRRRLRLSILKAATLSALEPNFDGENPKAVVARMVTEQTQGRTVTWLIETLGPKHYLSWSRRAADGDSDAQLLAGQCLEIGAGVERNALAAVAWYEKSAAAGNPAGMTALGYFHLRDSIRPVNSTTIIASLRSQFTAIRWFRQASEMTHLPAMVELARQLDTTKLPQDHTLATYLVLKAAEMGSADAVNTLGLWHAGNRNSNLLNVSPVPPGPPEYMREGDWLPHFYWYPTAVAMGNLDAVYNFAHKTHYSDESRQWYGKAGELGSPRAYYNLGMLYHDTTRIGHDPSKGFEAFAKAAKANFPLAISRLGVCYRDGIGVKRDLKKAEVHFNEAADLGEMTGLAYLLEMYLDGLKKDIDLDAVKKRFHQAADGRDPAGYYGLGLLAEYFGDKNRAVANDWYKLAASLGYARALSRESATSTRVPSFSSVGMVSPLVRWNHPQREAQLAAEHAVRDYQYHIGNNLPLSMPRSK